MPTWDSLEAYAFGQIGLSPSKFYDMTPREFANTSRGYSEKLEQQYRADWERARWVASVTIAPHTKKRLKPTELIKFPWENKRQGPNHVWSRGEVIAAHNQKFGSK